MKTWMKVGLVCLGYLLALGAGGVASYLYNARVAALPYDTSGGMYAEGDSLSALSVFLVAALVPTLLALWFLRRNIILWQMIAYASLAFAIVGLVSVLLPLVMDVTPRNPAMMVFSLLGLAQLLGVPFWTVAFGLFALLAPARRPRRVLHLAIGLELVIGVCAALHWFLPSSRI